MGINTKSEDAELSITLKHSRKKWGKPTIMDDTDDPDTQKAEIRGLRVQKQSRWDQQDSCW